MSYRPYAAFALSPSARDGVFPPDVRARLQGLVDVDPMVLLTSFDRAADRQVLKSVELLLTGWGCPQLDAETLRAAPRLRTVVHAAGSVKNFIHPAVFDHGVVVSSAAAANAVPVADYTMAALVLAGKQAFARARWYAGAEPSREWRSGAGTGLYGHTVGILGASRIGRLVLSRLRDLDVRVLLNDPYVDRDEATRLGAELVELDDLFRHSDVVSLHAPALAATWNLVDDRRLAMLRDGGTVINTARGSLVDTEALTRHCAAGRLFAVLDVTEPEPLPPGHQLLRLPNVLVTPHLAGAQGRDLRLLGQYAVDEVERLVTGRPMCGVVGAGDLCRIA